MDTTGGISTKNLMAWTVVVGVASSYLLSTMVPHTLNNGRLQQQLDQLGYGPVQVQLQTLVNETGIEDTAQLRVQMINGPASPNGLSDAQKLAGTLLEELPSTDRISVQIDVVQAEHGRPTDKVLYSFQHDHSSLDWTRKLAQNR